jgi:N-acetylglucosaminyldiphosphoundecaprenol N-acetyl-beta-D-mannosaminyltransferase
MRDGGKHNVLGVLVDAVDLDAAVARITKAALRREPYQVAALAVHGVMTGNRSQPYRERLNAFDLVVPDGQPVRWALNVLHASRLESSVRGTDLTLGVLRSAEEEGLPVFFYGSTSDVLKRVSENVSRLFPTLRVAGTTPSLFGPADQEIQGAIAETIRVSDARIVFVGLGCPRQETFVSALAPKVGVPMIAVGAAFDYLAGTLRQPPQVLRRFGLEWAWRLLLEPRRLWKRYLVLNPTYLGLLALQAGRLYHPAAPSGPAGELARVDA